MDLIDSMEVMSSGQTSMLDVAHLVVARMLALADSPLDVVRTARMMRAALRREMCRAASSPRPVLAPVIMIVCPVKTFLGTGSVVKNWEWRKCMNQRARAML